MAHPDTLTDQQLAILRWIADGCLPGVVDNEQNARISAAALRRRSLVTTRRRGSSWSAQITEAGRAYLQRAAGDDPPKPRQANVSVTQQLVDDVIAAGGSLLVPRPTGYIRRGEVDYRRRAEFAQAYGKVPAGKALRVSVASDTELAIELVDADELVSEPPAPVPVSAKVARYHPVARRLRDDDERHEVSRGLLPRALRVAQALVEEAERRGYTASAVDTPITYNQGGWTGPKHGHLAIAIGSDIEAIRFHEEGLPSRLWWARQHRQWTSSGWRLPPVSDYEQHASGRLCLSLVGYGGRGRASGWADRRKNLVEDRLPQLLAEIELRSSEAQERRDEAARAEQDRQRQWEAAMVHARERYHEHLRAEAVADQVQRWQHVTNIREFCDALQQRHGAAADQDWLA
jgi:hypothetical protein